MCMVVGNEWKKYVVTSDKHIRLHYDIEVKRVLSEVSLETLKKEQKLGERVSVKPQFK